MRHVPLIFPSSGSRLGHSGGRYSLLGRCCHEVTLRIRITTVLLPSGSRATVKMCAPISQVSFASGQVPGAAKRDTENESTPTRFCTCKATCALNNFNNKLYRSMTESYVLRSTTRCSKDNRTVDREYVTRMSLVLGFAQRTLSAPFAVHFVLSD